MCILVVVSLCIIGCDGVAYSGIYLSDKLAVVSVCRMCEVLFYHLVLTVLQYCSVCIVIDKMLHLYEHIRAIVHIMSMLASFVSRRLFP